MPYLKKLKPFLLRDCEESDSDDNALLGGGAPVSGIIRVQS